MALSSLFVWIPFLLSCVFQVSDNRNVHQDDLIGHTGNPEIPITLPEGIDPKHVTVKSFTIKTCTGMKEELALLNTKLQQTTLRNSQLDTEAFELRREARLLKLQLATCSATASAITGSYQTQLLNKMKQLLETFESDTFLILKIIALTREVNVLKNKVKYAGNVTETTEITALQRELQEKTNELNAKLQQIERSHTNSTLILQIISLQNQIWDLDQAESRRGEVNLQPGEKIQALQRQLDLKISELRSEGDADSGLLELISVHSKIALMQRLINLYIEESRTKAADYQRQWRQKVDLLRKKILLLNRDEKNKELTKEILMLQAEIEHFTQLMMNAKTTTESQLKELRVVLEEEKKRQDKLEKHLEQAEYAQAQLIMKIISIMKEVRELDDDQQHQTTSTSRATTLQTLLQAKETEFVKAQEEINELQRKLRLKSKPCSGFEERYMEIKTEFEQNIAELNRTGDSKAALILNVINLHHDLKSLRELISTTQDPDRISELQRQLVEKQEELNSKTADMERLFPNPRTVLLFIRLQDEIWDVQRKAGNETTGDHLTDLQNRVDGLISDFDDKGDDSTKLILNVLTLQSQVQQLQRQLSNLQTLQTPHRTQLTNDLSAKKEELQKYVNKLNEKNQINTELILKITELHNQLRNLENKKYKEDQTASAAVTKLREQLKATLVEQTLDKAVIEALQNKLNQTKSQCSSFEHKVKDLQNDLDAKMKELQSKSESVNSLALQISTLTLQLEELKTQLQNTESDTKIKELQKIIDEKNNELAKKTEELKERSIQAQRILKIIAIQTEIEKLAIVAVNDTDYEKIRALQDRLNYLIDGIQDENNENTQLMFKILAQQDEIARLEKQEKSQTQATAERIKDLENELEDVRNLIKEKTMMLDSSNTRIANLSAQILELHTKIKPLETKILDLKDTNAETVRELQKRLDLTKRQLQDSELQLKDTDAENFNLIMEIADLRTKLKKASKAAQRNSDELEQQLQTQQRENRRLENSNKVLKQEVDELKMCCTDNANTQCDDLQNELQQSQEDADRLQRQLRDKDVSLDQLQQNLEEQVRENTRLQSEYNQLKNKLSDVEDTTIYAEMMTLDPNTAHPRIVLSADNTQMSTSVEIQDVPDHPGRFDAVLAVLGKTGFSTGRHYWEVSVAGKLCYHLGMASESAQRKGAITFSPTNGFWTVILNKQSQYIALDRRAVTIPVQTQHLTVGILLDYKKGQVSFYDAAARSHMYSFVGQKFTDKIYPFINFCIEDVQSQTPIVLLPPGVVDWIK